MTTADTNLTDAQRELSAAITLHQLNATRTLLEGSQKTLERQVKTDIPDMLHGMIAKFGKQNERAPQLLGQIETFLKIADDVKKANIQNEPSLSHAFAVGALKIKEAMDCPALKVSAFENEELALSVAKVKSHLDQIISANCAPATPQYN